MSAIDKTFTGQLERSAAPGGWTYLVTAWSADFFGTRISMAGGPRIDGA